MFDGINEIPKDGILPAKWLRAAVQEDIINSDYRIPEQNYQPASLDLRLGEKAYILQCSFLPYSGPVATKLPELTIGEIDIRDGAILEKNRPYLIPLLESLKLPEGIRAKTNPKSSTGRLDIFTRVITDHSDRFDDIANGYQGRMYLEVFSRSFTVKVKTGLSLNQIRLFKGDSRCELGELRRVHELSPVIFPKAGQHEQWPRINEDNTVGLSVNLPGTPGTPTTIGYRAKKNSTLLDLSQSSRYHARDFWEPVFGDRYRRLILEPEEFYLLFSTESVSIPPEFAAEMTAYETSPENSVPTTRVFLTQASGSVKTAGWEACSLSWR